MMRVIPAYRTLVDVIQDAIGKESDAERFYTEAAELASTPEVRDFLLGMARMEHDHYTMLSDKLASLKADQTVMNGILSSYDDQPEERR